MKISNIKIGTKILVVIAAFGVSSVAMTIWQNANLKAAQKQYERVIYKYDTALLSGARMNQNIFAMTSSINGLAYQRCPSAACDIYEAQIKEADDRFTKLYAHLIELAPEYKGEFEPLKRRFDVLSGEIRNRQVGLALKNDTQTLQPALAAQAGQAKALTTDLRNAIDRRVKENEANIDALHAKISADALLGLLVSIFLVVTITSLAALIAFGDIVRMIRKITDQMQMVSKGDLTLAIDGLTRGDEIGAMAKTLEVFRQGLSDAETLRADTEALKIRTDVERRQSMLSLADSFESSVGNIVSLVSSAATEMQASASQLTATAQETSAQSVAVSAAAEQAGANVTSVASAAEELGASVSEIGRQVSTSSQISGEAVCQADAAGAVVDELNEVALSIGGVVDLIAGLAGQTNLLALNATIESARAGEAGKGFAVVASEVKALAAQTAKATSEISAKIAQIQDATTKAAQAFQNITFTIQNINATNSVIAEAVDQQTAATQEIIQAVNQASLGTQEVTSNIAGVAQASEQTGDAAAQVLTSSGELAQQAAKLKSEMDKFLLTVRAA